jgi:release factor glutamine methyltransferase
MSPLRAASAADICPGMRVEAVRQTAARATREAGLDTPELDARVLIGHALGLDHAGLASAADRRIDSAEAETIRSLVTRRLSREPVAHIMGQKEFWGLPFRVTPATLVPRPETETVVEAALAVIDGSSGRGCLLRIADLGTGSGALLLALLSELPQAYGIGTDVSADALTVAQENATRLSLADRAAFMRGDFTSVLGRRFDLIVSNPPYIPSSDIASLAPEVRDHEPRLALDGGPDGLAAYRAIATDSGRVLAPGGHLVLEIGTGQASAVTQVFANHGLRPAKPPLHDLAGIPRAVILHQKCGRQARALKKTAC